MKGHLSKHQLDAAIGARLSLTRNFRHGLLFLAAALLILPLIGLGGIAGMGQPEGAATMCAALPFFGMASPIFDKTNGNPDGGGDDPLARQIMQKIDAAKDATEILQKHFAELDGESKKLAQEFAKVTGNFDGLSSDVKTLHETMKKMEAKIANERRSNGMSALQRITQDHDMKTALNQAIRANYLLQKNKSENGIAKEWLNNHKALADVMNGKTITGGAEPGSTYFTTALIPDLYSLVAEYGVWSGFDVIRVGARTNTLLVDGADPTMGVVAEGVAPSEADPQGTSVSLAIKKLLGWVGVATELLEDAETDVASILLRKFANATAYRLDWFCLAADGGDDATDGGMTGIFGGGGTAAAAASGNVSIATHDYEDWIKPLTVVDAPVLTRPARWWIHPTLLAKVLGVKDSNGRSIFLPSTEAPSFSAFGSIFGYPITMAHAAPSADTTSSKIAVFGDPMGQAVGLRSDMNFVASDQAKFTEDEVVFRCRARGGSKIRKATAFGVLTSAAS